MKNIINNLKLILIIIIWLFTLKYMFNVILYTCSIYDIKN